MSIHAVRDEHRAAPDVGVARHGRLTASISGSVHGSRTWTIVAIAGDMDLLVLPLVRTLVSSDSRHLVFDLRRVTFVDASVDAQLPTFATLDEAVAAPASGPSP